MVWRFQFVVSCDFLLSHAWSCHVLAQHVSAGHVYTHVMSPHYLISRHSWCCLGFVRQALKISKPVMSSHLCSYLLTGA